MSPNKDILFDHRVMIRMRKFNTEIQYYIVHNEIVPIFPMSYIVLIFWSRIQPRITAFHVPLASPAFHDIFEILADFVECPSIWVYVIQFHFL